MAEGLATIGIIYLIFFIGLGIIAILVLGLRILLELIKEHSNEKWRWISFNYIYRTNVFTNDNNGNTKEILNDRF